MASRLYGTTKQVFLRVVQVLRALGIPTVLSPTAGALLALYVTGLVLLDRRQTPWRMQAWLPARCHDAMQRSRLCLALVAHAGLAPCPLP